MSVTFQGQIPVTLKTFDTQNEAAFANNGAFVAGTSETIECARSSTTCDVFIAAGLGEPNPSSADITLTFTCPDAAEGYSCSTTNNTITFGHGSSSSANNQIGWVKITVTIPAERGTAPTPLTIEGAVT